MLHAGFEDGGVCMQESDRDPCPGTSKESGTSVYGQPLELDSANTLSEFGSGFSLRVSR